ncbi:MAG: translocation/assembly module TamB domain-containing protein [Bacteroidales bacterium]|nr:translocation/assembly module TamB domain-containing protein [Bacteroidales bacterium]
MTKRNPDIAARIFGFIVLLLATAAVAVQSPDVQSRLVRTFLERSAGKMDGRIEFSSVNFQSPGTIALTDVLILDKNPYDDKLGTGNPTCDTIFFAKEVRGTVSTGMLLKKKGLHLSRVEVRDVDFFLAMEPDAPGRMNITRVFGEGNKDSTSTGFPISISKIYGENIHYRMSEFTKLPKPCTPTAINYDRLDAQVSTITAHNLNVNGGKFSMTVDNVDIVEKCGADAKVSMRMDIDRQFIQFRDIHIVDGTTDLRAPLYSMTGTTPNAYKDYCRAVRMRLKVAKGSIVSAKTISKFSLGQLDNMDFLLDIDEAEADGYVSDLNISKLKFTDLYGGIKGDATCRLTGITLTEDFLLDAKIGKLNFATAGAEKTIRRMTGKDVKLKNFAPGQKISFSGNAKGPLSKLAAKGKIKTGNGSADADLTIKNLASKTEGTEVGGVVRAHNLGLGRIIDKDFLGNVTANTGFKAVLNKDNVSVKVDSLMIDRLGLLGYDYTGIAAAGTYSDNAFDGKIICADPNLNFIFQGIFNLSPKTKNALYKFSANVGYADLEALNLDTRGGTSKVSAELSANLMKIPRGDLLGDFNIYDLTLENDNGVKYIGDVYAGSHTTGGTSRAQISSSFLDAGYVGNRSITDLFNDIQAITTRRELPAIYSRKDKDKGDPDANYDITVDFHDSRDILSFIKPGMYISDSTKIDLRMANGDLSGIIHSSRMAYMTNYLKGLDIILDNQGGSLNASVLTDEFRMGQIGFVNSALIAFAQSNGFFLSFHYDNISGMDNVGELYLAGNIERDATDTLIVHAKPLSSYVRFEDSQWDLAESDITYRSGEASFNNFSIVNGDQAIRINGGISRSMTDTLTVGIDNVDMSLINHFTGKDYGFAGRTTGRGILSSPLKGDMMGMVNLNCDSLAVAGENAGSLRMALVWDKAADKVSAFIRDINDGLDALNIKANYAISNKILDASAVADGLHLALLSPLLPDALTGLGGSLSGYFKARGNLDSLALSSDSARIEGGKLKVAYTGVDYKLGGPFHIDNKGLHFDNFNITDPEGGFGILNGGLLFSNLKDFSLDTDLALNNLMVFGNKSGTIYGDLFVSGNAYLTGPMDAINMDADIFTNKAGTMHVSLGGASSASVGDLLTFTDHTEEEIDPYDEMLREILQQVATQKQSSASNFTAHARINATTDLEAVLELDNTGDNFLTARGSGLLIMDVNSARKIFDVTGDYNISNGKYHFALPGIVSKNFNIENGSSIKFGGDVMNSELDIDATYTLRTSINRLMADTSSVATRRTVNCGIRISDKLSSPKVDFSIDIPDLDPSTKSEVESALNTEDKVQKQFLALLITGSFLENEQSGIVNNTNLVFSNVSEVMSRQLSNLLNLMDIPVDLGVGYQQNASGTDLYDVSVSTELFDNRVEVRGSFGNRQYSTTTNPNGDMVGDLDIDVKLDKPGELRLNLFSHSADEYTSYLDYSQRNGVGITYQREFNKWKDFWRSLFISRKKRQELNREASLTEEKQTITIEADE